MLGGRKNKIFLLHLIEGGRLCNFLFVTQSIKADHLDSGVFETHASIEIEYGLVEYSRIGNKGFEAIAGQSEIEGVARRERFFSIAEIVPRADKPGKNAQIRACHNEGEGNRLHAPV